MLADTSEQEQTATEKRPALTHGRLREVLSYDPATGDFTRRTPRPGARAGDKAGHLHRAGAGYVYIMVDHRSYLAHRLAWLYVHGVWPDGLLDHINRDKSDNRIANLRPADFSLNAQNAVSGRAGRALPLGVYRYRKRFVAKIMVRGSSRHLGCFDTPDQASAAYLTAKAELHKGAVL
jgi:hypothetical protein